MMTLFAPIAPKAAALSAVVLAVVACVFVCLPYGAAQMDQATAWLQGFSRIEWNHSRPERACNYIKSRLQHANREQVVALLGKPDRESDAGQGMWGLYDAYYSYILDSDPTAESRSYTWKELEISFAPTGAVSKIEVTGHCY